MLSTQRLMGTKTDTIALIKLPLYYISQLRRLNITTFSRLLKTEHILLVCWLYCKDKK